MSKNSETVMLSEINQKGTIIEPKRTLVFPIPASVQNWDRLRFGVAFSLTDLVNPEAELEDLSSNHEVTDSTESSFFWFGLTTNPNGNLPFRFGPDDVYVGFGSDTVSHYTDRYRMYPEGNMNSRLTTTNFAAVTIKGNTQLHDNVSGLGSSSVRRTFNIVRNGQMSRFHNTSLSVLMSEFEVNNRGESNQSMAVRGEELSHSNNTGAPLEIDYQDFSQESFVDVVGTAGGSFVAGSTVAFHDNGDPLPIPQNIIFHWPFFNRWRLRLHGALLIEGGSSE